MFDDDDGVALVDEGVEDFEEFADVLEVQARGRFVEDVERLAGGAAGEFLGELDALRLAAAERRRLLADLRRSRGRPRAASPACRGSAGRP